MSGAFDRLLFPTAMPFQLGHHELIRVLERFREVRWNEAESGGKNDFGRRLQEPVMKPDDSESINS